MEEKLQIATKIDTVVGKMLAAVEKVKQSQGSIVSLPKAELDLLGQIEIARDVMAEVLRNQNDRTLLQDVFGGDCARLVKIQTMCNSIELSAMNRQDQRLPTCLNVCRSIEKVIVELGDGEALRKAQESSKVAMHENGGLAKWVAEGPAVSSTALPGRQSQPVSPSAQAAADSSSFSADRVLSLVKADAERREARLREDLTGLEARLSEAEGGHYSVQHKVANFEVRLAKAEACITELRPTPCVGPVAQMPSASSEIADAISAFTRKMERTDELQRVALQQQRVRLEESHDKLDQRVAKAEQLLNDFDVGVQEQRQVQEQLSVRLEGRFLILKADADRLMSGLSTQVQQHRVDTEKRCADIEVSGSKSHGTFITQLSAVEQRLEGLARDHQQKQDTANSKREEHVQRIAGVEEHVKELKQCHSEMEQRCAQDTATAELSDRVSGAEEQVQQLWDSVLKMEIVAKQVTAEEIQSLSGNLMEKIRIHGDELEKLRSTTDMDPLWQSFAHVGTLVQSLNERIDDISPEKLPDCIERSRSYTS